MIRISNHLKRVTDPEGATLLDIKSGRFFRLNVLGSRILSLLEAGCDLPQIVDQLLNAPHDRRTLEADVESFLKTLEARGLVCRILEAQANGETHG